jgi:protoheme IX farnesyltransferase
MPTNSDGHIDHRIGIQSVLYVIFLFPVGVLPYYLGISGWISLVVVSLMTLVYLFFAVRFKIKFNRQSALALMFSSFFYIPVSLIAFLLDKI